MMESTTIGKEVTTMKIRRIAALLLAVMLVLSLCSVASAQGITKEYTVQVRSLNLNDETNTMAMMGVDSRLYALYAADGTRISEEKYIKMSPQDTLYEVAVENGLNTLGVMDSTGKMLVPMMYGDIQYVSEKWQLGVVLAPATADNYDYKTIGGDTEFYIVSVYDVYYCGTRVGSLGRTDYYAAYAYGDYLYVSNKERVYSYYDKDFKASGYSDSSSSEYHETRNGIYHRGSGQQAFTAGCTLTSDEVALDIMEVDGRFVDLQGNVVFAKDAKFSYIAKFKGDYAQTSMSNGKKGLIDRTGREVLECVYDNIPYNDTYFEGGYQSAVKDGKFGYLNTNGEVTYGFKYAENAVKSNYKAPLTYLNDLDGSVVVLSAVAGELPVRFKEVRILNANGCPVFAAETAEKKAGIFDVYGNEIIPADGTYDDTYDFQISQDGTLIAASLGGGEYKIYLLDVTPVAEEIPSETEEPAEPAEDGSWKCSNGHSNTGKFCAECGEARPADKLKCSKCGFEPKEGTAPKFCAECGNAF